MNNVRQFSISKYNISNYKNDPRFMLLTLYICCSNKEANKSLFLDEAIENCKDSFIGVPIVAKIKESFSGSDFMGHELEVKQDKDGAYINYLETNMGFIPESSNIRIEPDAKNPEQKWIVADAILWKERNHQAYKILKSRRKVSISMEVEFQDFEVINGIEVVKKFMALGVCMLGQNVPPAFKTSVAVVAENFQQFKNAMCFALNGEQLPLEEEIKNLEKGGENVVDETKVMEAFAANISGYEYMGFGEKAVYGFKDGKVYAIPYETVEDTVKMSAENAYECNVYAEYAVETLSEEDKVEGVSANVDNSNPAGKQMTTIEQFACGNKMSEKFSNVFSEKEDMSAKYEEFKTKFADVSKNFEVKEAEVKEMSEKFEAMKTQFEEMSCKYAETEKELNEYRSKEFANNVDAVMANYTLKENEIADWKAKSREYSSVECFEKDLVYSILKTSGSVKREQPQNTTVKYAVNTPVLNNTKKVDKNNPIEVLKAEFGKQ